MSATPYSVMAWAWTLPAKAALSATHKPRIRTGARWWVVFMWSRVFCGVAFATGTLHRGGRPRTVAIAPCAPESPAAWSRADLSLTTPSGSVALGVAARAKSRCSSPARLTDCEAREHADRAD